MPNPKYPLPEPLPPLDPDYTPNYPAPSPPPPGDDPVYTPVRSTNFNGLKTAAAQMMNAPNVDEIVPRAVLAINLAGQNLESHLETDAATRKALDSYSAASNATPAPAPWNPYN